MKLVALIVFLLLLAASGYGVHAVWAADMAHASSYSAGNMCGTGSGLVLLIHLITAAIMVGCYLESSKSSN